MVDTEDLFNGYSIDLRDALHGVGDVMAKSSTWWERRGFTRRKLAVVFTKRDLFAILPEFNPEQRFRELYLDAHESFRQLQHVEAKYFFVSAVGETEVNKSGERRPGRGFAPEKSPGLLSPLLWLADLDGVAPQSEPVSEGDGAP